MIHGTVMTDIKHTPVQRQVGEERKLTVKGKPRKEKNLVKENLVKKDAKGKQRGKEALVNGDKNITIYIYMNNNKYINPSSKLLKEMAKLSQYELIVLSKNYKKFIDNIKSKDKIKQNEIEKKLSEMEWDY